MSVIVIVIALFAAVFLAVGWVWRVRHRSMRRAARATCASLPAPGSPCDLVGTAVPLRPAPFSGTPCAWYRVRATAKTPSGKNTFLDEKSDAPFYLEDHTGRLAIHPEHAFMDGPVRTFDERRATNGTLPGTSGEVGEYHYEEWTLPAGTSVYVLGTSANGTIGKDPEIGQYTISTRDARAYRRRAVLFMAVGYGTGALLVALAALLVIVDHIT
ncbi:GIDE domain-containing protein [Spirillospora albida]|uniref:GIDE domain-containing protein n=1 Tax=Spirillospora albida TaxID=58123 RepID=UPI0004C0C0DF|nr:GIDE domain-containing protein [Spirillospora albida]